VPRISHHRKQEAWAAPALCTSQPPASAESASWTDTVSQQPTARSHTGGARVGTPKVSSAATACAGVNSRWSLRPTTARLRLETLLIFAARVV
jgi:hypothetical protein